MIDVIAKVFAIILGRKVAFSLEDVIWKQTEKSKRFKNIFNIIVKVLSAIVIVFVVLVLIFSLWFFYKYFKGEL